MTSSFLLSVGSAIGNHLWQTTGFTTAIWLLALFLRNNPARIRYSLWLAASLKFLLPFSLLLTLGSLVSKSHQIEAPAMYSAIGLVGAPFSEIEPPHAPLTPQPSTLREGAAVYLPAGLLGVWLGGVGSILLVWYFRWRKLSAILRKSRPACIGREVNLLRRMEQATGAPAPIPLRLSIDLLEPGIFGILRPVLLWPEQLSMCLEDEHMEAILAHELMHARRHDNLTAALHMLVEAVFWFHPMVWWVERCMVEERERACDEAVIQFKGRSEAYAESLLKACRFCVEARLRCVSGITGADLNKRIVSILTAGFGERLGLGRILLLVAIGMAFTAGPFAAGFVHVARLRAQLLYAPKGPLPSFEVATIKPSHSNAMLGFRITPARFEAEGASVTELLRFAYSTRSDAQLPKVPRWIGSERFDIDAKFGDAQVEALKKLTPDQRFDQYRLMVQALLADRFKLKVNIQAVDLPVYALMVAKAGPKLKEVQGGLPFPPSERPGPPPPPPPPGATISPGAHMPKLPTLTGEEGHLQAGAVSMPFLTDWLWRLPEMENRVIIDQTGLKGNYDFELNWTPDETHATPNNNGSPAGTEPADASPARSSGPSIFTALQDQLGLKLVPKKAPVEVLIIDHVEEPSPD